MIKIAPKEYRIRSTYEDAMLYCFSLNINGKTGWRLPTRKEFEEYSILVGWYQDRISYSGDNESKDEIYSVIPVRDIA